MNDLITKDDLRQFGLLLLNDMRKMVEEHLSAGDSTINQDWLKSKTVRKILDISPGTIQNLRVTGKIRFKKVLGSYYYSRQDINNLFEKSDVNGN